jgi:hypothetical protein
VTFPGILPLWLAGASKGLTLAAGAEDLIFRAKREHLLPPALTGIERGLMSMTIGMALAGSFLNIVLHLPSYMISVTTVLLLLMFTTDGLQTGACTPHGGRPTERPSLPLTVFLATLAALTAPVGVAPVALGALIMLVGLGVLPSLPAVPGFGFMDLEQAFKRAGLVQSSGWPALHVAAILMGVVLLQGVLGVMSVVEQAAASE